MTKFLSVGKPGGRLTFFLLVCIPYAIKFSSSALFSLLICGEVKAEVTIMAGWVGGVNLVVAYLVDLIVFAIVPRVPLEACSTESILE